MTWMRFALTLVGMSCSVNLRCHVACAGADSGADMRALAPQRPSHFNEPETLGIAVPQSGNSLDSVGQDWFTRQAHLMTNGNDQKFLEGVNRQINSVFERPRESASVSPSPGESTADASEKEAVVRPAASSDAATPFGSSLSALVPDIRFTAVNKMEFGLIEQTHLSCSVEGSGVHWDLSRTLYNKVDFGLRHDPASNVNSVRFLYNW